MNLSQKWALYGLMVWQALRLIVNNALYVCRCGEIRGPVVDVELISLHNMQHYLDAIIRRNDGDTLSNILLG